MGGVEFSPKIRELCNRIEFWLLASSAEMDTIAALDTGIDSK
jgi:hypothetical protein